MNVQFMGATVVILAQNHNPSIASKDWLLAKDILSEAPVNFVHMPVLSQFDSENFNLVVEENRWQLRAKNTSPDTIEQLPKVAHKYVQELPETVYTAVGTNWDWRVKDESTDLLEFARTLFVPTEGHLSQIATRPNFTMNATLAFDEEPFRVQATLNTNPKEPHELRWRINYHRDVKGSDSADRLSQIEEALSVFDSLQEKSRVLIDELMQS